MEEPEYYRRFTESEPTGEVGFVNFLVVGDRFIIQGGSGRTWNFKGKFGLAQIQEIAIELLNLGAEVETGTGRQLAPGQEAFSSKEKFQALQQILDSLSPEETEKLKRGDWQGREIVEEIAENEKPDNIAHRAEVLQHLYQKFGRDWFITRQCYEMFPWGEEYVRTWINRLKNSGQLNVETAEHEDPQVRKKYRISREGARYIRRHS